MPRMALRSAHFFCAAVAVLWTLTVSAQNTLTVKGKVFSQGQVDHDGHDYGLVEGGEEKNWQP
ncbi:MAG: hypothetical protein CMC97_01390, partial [Flavobacteriales bacterium]|nr:hypothetical protein [Flavobacteriales bacterium]